MRLRLISWNVNGLRACINKGFMEYFKETGADMLCLQETKMQADQVQFSFDGYSQYFNSAVKKGYSGTALFSKTPPLSVDFGLGVPEHDTEGRVLTAEYPGFYLINLYAPNSQRELARLPYRMEWEDVFREYVIKLDRIKPVVLCGDLNAAHQEIDIKNPKSNLRNAGFTVEERCKLTELLASGFIDTYRFLNPEQTGAYTWWSYQAKARENNTGWRIDYFIISEKLRPNLVDAAIYPEVMGSDHCPVGLFLEL